MTIKQNPKTSYQNFTVIPIPGVNLSTNTFTITGQSPTIRNGVYTCSSSATYPGYDAFLAFTSDHNAYQRFWASLTGRYSGDGTYTYVNSLGSYNGEWIKIQLPYAFKLTSYTIKNMEYLPRAVVDHYLLGSTDGTSWTLIDTRLNQSPTASPITFTLSPVSTSYNYYGFVISKINPGGDLAAIENLTLVGNYP
jgi:hypothetical protein